MLIEQLKRHEGFRAELYKCSTGQHVIGYGRNISYKTFTQQELLELILANGVTEKLASKWLHEEVERIQSDIKTTWDLSFFPELNEARQAVLINMAYSVGALGVVVFSGRMTRALKDGLFEKAAKEMLDSRWARQVGDRAVELSEQMRTGEWQSR